MTKSNSYKELLDLVKQLDEMTEMSSNVIFTNLENEGVDVDKAKYLFKTIEINSIQSIKETDAVYTLLSGLFVPTDNIDETIHEFAVSEYIRNKAANTEPSDEYINSFTKEFDDKWNTDEGKRELSISTIGYIMNSIKEVDDLKKEAEVQKKEAYANIDKHIERITSDEYEEKVKQKIKEMIEKAEACTDEKEKQKLLKNAETIQSAHSLAFLYNRINTFKDSELDNVVNNFFDKTKSGYILKKCRANLKRFKYGEDSYHMLTNLEEKFLDEKYHKYNNFFLFFVVRYIAYANADEQNSKLFVSSLMSNTGNLVYHRFASDNREKAFIDIIEKFLDQFEKYSDKFEKDNAMAPNHPKRIAKRKAMEIETREMIYKNLEYAGFEITDDVKNLEMSALRELYERYLDEIDKKKTKEAMGTLSEIIDKYNLDSDVWKRDNLLKEYLAYSELTDEMREKFKTISISELQEIVDNAKKEFEEKSVEEEIETEEDNKKDEE